MRLRQFFKVKPLAALRAVAAARSARPRNPRARIAAWAIGIGLVAGGIDLMLPVEDSFRAVRANEGIERERLSYPIPS